MQIGRGRQGPPVGERREPAHHDLRESRWRVLAAAGARLRRLALISISLGADVLPRRAPVRPAYIMDYIRLERVACCGSSPSRGPRARPRRLENPFCHGRRARPRRGAGERRLSALGLIRGKLDTARQNHLNWTLLALGSQYAPWSWTAMSRTPRRSGRMPTWKRFASPSG